MDRFPLMPTSRPHSNATSADRAFSFSQPRTLYSLFVGLLGLGLLGYQLAAGEQALGWLPVLVFATLSFLVQRSSFHLGSPTVHSLAGVIDVAAIIFPKNSDWHSSGTRFIMV